MTQDGTVNGQIVDSVSGVATLVTGIAPSQAHAMLDAVLVETLGMLMHSAVSRQQSAGMISAAATTAACARMLNAGTGIPLPPATDAVPPTVNPVPGPPPSTPSVAIATAFSQGQQAIDTLLAQAKDGGTNADAAKQNLAALVQEASAGESTPPPATGSGTTPVTDPQPSS
jgi:Killing trait